MLSRNVGVNIQFFTVMKPRRPLSDAHPPTSYPTVRQHIFELHRTLLNKPQSNKPFMSDRLIRHCFPYFLLLQNYVQGIIIVIS
jgi:hypothetical protein